MKFDREIFGRFNYVILLFCIPHNFSAESLVCYNGQVNICPANETDITKCGLCSECDRNYFLTPVIGSEWEIIDGVPTKVYSGGNCECGTDAEGVSLLLKVTNWSKDSYNWKKNKWNLDESTLRKPLDLKNKYQQYICHNSTSSSVSKS